MVWRATEATELEAAAAQCRAQSRRATRDRGAVDGAYSLAQSACVFAARCHARQRRASDGAPFIAHPLEVARLLREAGCSDVVVAAGLLHDVVEDTDVSVAELKDCFGAVVADLVQAVTDDPSIPSYRQRKRMLREQVRCAGAEAALLFAADKISKVRELFDQGGRDGRPTVTIRRDDPVQPDRQLRLEHYHQSLDMLEHVVPRHPLVVRLATELADRQLAARSDD